jgi:hypothetical protein
VLTFARRKIGKIIQNTPLKGEGLVVSNWKLCVAMSHPEFLEVASTAPELSPIPGPFPTEWRKGEKPSITGLKSLSNSVGEGFREGDMTQRSKYGITHVYQI